MSYYYKKKESVDSALQRIVNFTLTSSKNADDINPFALHNHDIFELSAVTMGRLDVSIDEAVYELSEGDIIIANPMANLFVGYDDALAALTERGFYFYSASFLFAGFAIYGSSFFTALNDGLTSAIISFVRTLIFQVAAVLVLPMLLGVDGIWLSGVASEVMAMALVVFFIFGKNKKYGYL